MPGPPPKKEAERRRRNKDDIPVEVVNLDEMLAGEVEVPVADEDWHPIARSWYESLKSSGQALWYEPSDWMTAYLLAEVLDRWLKPQDIKVGQIGDEDGSVTYVFEQKVIAMPGATLNSLLKGMSALMVTEGERRKLRIELERKKAVEAALGGDGVVVPISQKRMERFSS